MDDLKCSSASSNRPCPCPHYCLTQTREKEGHQRGHTVEVLEKRRRHLFKHGVNLVESLATTLISRCRVEKLGEVLLESVVDHVGHTLKLVRQSTSHVYRQNSQGLSCPQRLSGQFFALEDLGNLRRLEDGLELDSGWRLGGVGVHRSCFQRTVRFTNVRCLPSRTACACASSCSVMPIFSWSA